MAVSWPAGSLQNGGQGIFRDEFWRAGVTTRRSELVFNAEQVSEAKRFKAVGWPSKEISLPAALGLPAGHSPAWARGYSGSLSPLLSICEMNGLTQPECLHGSFQVSAVLPRFPSLWSVFI